MTLGPRGIYYSDTHRRTKMNVALNKAAQQSSTYQTYVAANAVDGNATADWTVETCSHTDPNDPVPYWVVDLGERMTLEGFNITYRQQQPLRMSGFRLIVSNTSLMVDGISGTLCYEEARLNPPTIQYIDCFVIGQYVFYEDPTTAPGDLVPIIELCELEAFGCRNGSYGPDCNTSCVEGCQSGICYPDNGTCVYGCKPTWLGDKCDQVCMNGTWGALCNETCFCDIDTCNVSTGMCQEDRCQPGWQGIHCNQRKQGISDIILVTFLKV
ncbi:fucolectin-1-like [Ylistrum balloti]|uniref:fucolectin-1-like n=1 Tax=Ylistrum balloti TaxID=509963 RepID=UPI00290592AE|nr:fucolectin-1-like [Ylistrum balloti]